MPYCECDYCKHTGARVVTAPATACPTSTTDQQPKPPDENRPLGERRFDKNRKLATLTDRLQHETAELQDIILDLRELLASL